MQFVFLFPFDVVKRSACNPNPCLNNAQCILDGFKGFQCVCLEGYSGRTCDGMNCFTFQPFSTCNDATRFFYKKRVYKKMRLIMPKS